MADKPPPDHLFTTRWVHIAEEDTADGAVYRPDDEHVPLSRKPRNWLEFRKDGSAKLFAPGPDDRPVEQATTWRDAGAAQRRDATPAASELEIVEQSPSRLVIRPGRRS